MWYYTHVPITPIWSQPDTLIYHATLPFHDRERYLLYSLHSFPLPSAPGIFTQFKLKKHIALHTVSGKLLIPKFCVGYNPTICHTGPHFSRKLFQCERAIVTQDETLREKGLVTIMDTPTSSIVQEINPGEYALSTHQLRAHKKCEGKPEEIINFDSGSYLVQLNNKCSLKTLNWTINSITHIKSSRKIPITSKMDTCTGLAEAQCYTRGTSPSHGPHATRTYKSSFSHSLMDKFISSH